MIPQSELFVNLPAIVFSWSEHSTKIAIESRSAPVQNRQQHPCFRKIPGDSKLLNATWAQCRMFDIGTGRQCLLDGALSKTIVSCSVVDLQNNEWKVRFRPFKIILRRWIIFKTQFLREFFVSFILKNRTFHFYRALHQPRRQCSPLRELYGTWAAEKSKFNHCVNAVFGLSNNDFSQWIKMQQKWVSIN